MSTPNEKIFSHALPAVDTVQITGGRPSSIANFQMESNLNITWKAKGIGKFEFNVNHKYFPPPPPNFFENSP